jgi:site-specific DNA-methyltransferase (adenine-specific)
LIAAYSKPGDIILDPFAGSGTTVVAAKQLGRRYIAMELEARYCKIAQERLNRIHP